MREISGKTVLCALLGNPTEHSLSPLIHNSLAEAIKTDMAYTTFCVENDRLGEAVAGAYALGIKGMNVTVPYKEAVMEHLVGVDPIAKAIGAVNTLVRTDGGYYGYNTDILGFIRELNEFGFDIKDRDVVIFGAGGVARAICFACAKEGASRIFILNRTLEKAQAIAKDADAYFGFDEKTRVIPESIDNSENLDTEDFLLVQTTNVGMYPKNGEVILEESVLYEKAAFGFDVIYNPFDTVFMKKLRRKDKRAVNGLQMLLYQAIESYKMWFDDTTVSNETERDIYDKLKEALYPVDKEELAVKDQIKGNIILTGFMGSGKTTLGKWIARHTERTLVDTDREIEAKHGITIREIFETKGEEVFRQMETDYLKELARSGKRNLIISIGGGTPLRKENRALLKKIGTVVYLRASSEELMRRLRYDTRRPLLQGKDGEERKELIEKMLSERDRIYMEAADIVVITDRVYFPRLFRIIQKKYVSGLKYKKNRHKNGTGGYKYRGDNGQPGGFRQNNYTPSYRQKNGSHDTPYHRRYRDYNSSYQ